MKNVKILLLTFTFLFLNFSLISASHVIDQENLTDLQKVVLPHLKYYKTYYKKDNLLQDMVTPEKQLEVAVFFYKVVTLDQDYLAARALLSMASSHSIVCDFLTKQKENFSVMLKIIKLRQKYDKEAVEIEKSIAKSLEIMNRFGAYYDKASRWLKEFISLKAIKYCAKELSVLEDKKLETKEIVKILASTKFGNEQIKKVIKFRKYCPIDLGNNLLNDFQEPYEIDRKNVQSVQDIYNLESEDEIDREEKELDRKLFESYPEIHKELHKKLQDLSNK